MIEEESPTTCHQIWHRSLTYRPLSRLLAYKITSEAKYPPDGARSPSVRPHWPVFLERARGFTPHDGQTGFDAATDDDYVASGQLESIGLLSAR